MITDSGYPAEATPREETPWLTNYLQANGLTDAADLYTDENDALFWRLFYEWAAMQDAESVTGNLWVAADERES